MSGRSTHPSIEASSLVALCAVCGSMVAVNLAGLSGWGAVAAVDCSRAGTGADLAVRQAISMLLYAGTGSIILLLMCRMLGLWGSLGLRRLEFRGTISWLLGVPVLLLLYLLAALRHGVQPLPGYVLDLCAASGPLLVLAVAVVVPFYEELMFRGLLLGWAESRSRKTRLAMVLASSLVWSVLHLQYGPFQVSFIFVLGLALGVARLNVGSTWLPVAMHVLNNSIVLLACPSR